MPTPAINTADVVALYPRGEGDNLWSVLLVQRKWPPYAGLWSLPGGHVDPDETVEEAAVREFHEEVGLIVHTNDLVLMFMASTPGRDPRGRYISSVYATTLLDDDVPNIKAGDDAGDCKLFALEDAMQMRLAFDHNEILYRIVRAGSFYTNR